MGASYTVKSWVLRVSSRCRYAVIIKPLWLQVNTQLPQALRQTLGALAFLFSLGLRLFSALVFLFGALAFPFGLRHLPQRRLLRSQHLCPIGFKVPQMAVHYPQV